MIANAIQAVTFILTEFNMEKKAKVITETIMEKLDAQLEAFKEEAQVITATIGIKAAKATDILKEQLTKIADKIAEEIKTAMTGINKTTTKLVETTTKYTDTLTQPTQPMNYRDALKQPSSQNTAGTPLPPPPLIQRPERAKA
jgi:hypothetical protein